MPPPETQRRKRDANPAVAPHAQKVHSPEDTSPPSAETKGARGDAASNGNGNGNGNRRGPSPDRKAWLHRMVERLARLDVEEGDWEEFMEYIIEIKEINRCDIGYLYGVEESLNDEFHGMGRSEKDIVQRERELARGLIKAMDEMEKRALDA